MITTFDMHYDSKDIELAEKLDNFISENELQEKLDGLHSYDEMFNYAKWRLDNGSFGDVRVASFILDVLTENQVYEYYRFDYDNGTINSFEGIDSINDLFDVYADELEKLGIENPEKDINEER